MTLSKQAEDALLLVAERGEKHVVAPLGAVRNILLDAGLIQHRGPGTRTTDTATPAGIVLAAYIRREREREALEAACVPVGPPFHVTVQVNAPSRHEAAESVRRQLGAVYLAREPEPPRPSYIPANVPWAYVTDGRGRKVGAWVADGGDVRIHDPDSEWPWTYAPERSPT